MSESIWRILDANLNRCNEGLRVLEDWCRFVANQPETSSRLKEIRHQLQTISSDWPAGERLSARDAAGDVGRELTTSTEHQRQDDASILQANFSRVQQSLRVLEEFAKRLSLASQPLERLRYLTYDLHRDVYLQRFPITTGTATATSTSQSIEDRRSLLERARLYVLTGLSDDLPQFERHLEQLISGGADIIQLRDKSADDRQLFDYASIAASRCQAAQVLLIINDRPDLALAVGADGVHVGQEELPVHVVRDLVGRDLLIGLSTHSSSQVVSGLTLDTDYLGVGPVFASGTKAFSDHVGPELLKDVADRLSKPAFAIGGIDQQNVAQVLEAGFRRIAVQGAVGTGHDVLSKTRQMKAILAGDEPSC